MPIPSLPHFPFHYLQGHLLPSLYPRWDTDNLAPNSQEDRSMDYPSRSSSADPLSQPEQTSTASHLPRKPTSTISDNGMDTDQPSSSDPAGLGAYADDATSHPSNNEEGREAFLSTLHSISSPRHRPASRMRTQDGIARPASGGGVHREKGVSTPKHTQNVENTNVFFNDDHHAFPMINLAPPSSESLVEQTHSSSSTPTQNSPSPHNDSSSQLEQGTQSQQHSQSQQSTHSQQSTQSQQGSQSQQHQAKPTDQSKPAEPSADDPSNEGEPSDALTPLEAYDWDGLEAEFEAEMKQCQDREDGFVEEFEAWIKVRQSTHTILRSVHARLWLAGALLWQSHFRQMEEPVSP